MEFKKVASFQKDFIFISVKHLLSRLCRFITDNEFLMNLEIKIGISLCDSDILFLFKTEFS